MTDGRRRERLADNSINSTLSKPLRLWPGGVAAVLLVLAKYALPLAVPEAALYGVMGGLVLALVVLLWWLLLSRAPWSERLGVIALMAAAFYATSYLVDVSIPMGILVIQAIPPLSLA